MSPTVCCAIEELSFHILKVLFIPPLEWNLTWLFISKKPTQTKEGLVPPTSRLFSACSTAGNNSDFHSKNKPQLHSRACCAKELICAVCSLLTFLLEYMMNFYGGWWRKGRTTFKWNPTSFSSTVSFQKPDKSQKWRLGKECTTKPLWKPPSISFWSGKVTPRHHNSSSPDSKLTGKCFLICFPQTDTFAADLMRIPADDLFTEQNCY